MGWSDRRIEIAYLTLAAACWLLLLVFWWAGKFTGWALVAFSPLLLYRLWQLFRGKAAHA